MGKKDRGTNYYEQNLFGERTSSRQQVKLETYKQKVKPARQNANKHCLTCIHAHLMQWDENPIIAQCDVFQQRMVARVCICPRYEESEKPMDEITAGIEHLSHHGK